MKIWLAILIAGVLFICIGFVALVTRDWPTYNDDLLAMSVPDVPAKYHGEIRVGGKGGLYWNVDGREHYLKHYNLTWQSCRHSFYRGSPLYFENETNQVGPWSSVVPGDMFDAQRSGWVKCRSQIEELQKRFPDDEIRAKIVDRPLLELASLSSGLILVLASTAWRFNRRTG